MHSNAILPDFYHGIVMGLFYNRVPFPYFTSAFSYHYIFHSVIFLICFHTFVTLLISLSYMFSQGDQNSPGIIPLAIKDVFSIIQDVSIQA